MIIQAMKESCKELRKEIDDVRFGSLGIILFEFRGKTYQAPEPLDVLPVGGDEESSKNWALSQILDGKAKEVN